MKETLKSALSIGFVMAVGGAAYTAGCWVTVRLMEKIEEKLEEKARLMEATKDEQ